MSRKGRYCRLLVLLLLLTVTGTGCSRNQEDPEEEQIYTEEGTYSFVTGGVAFHIPDQYQTSLSMDWGIILSEEGIFEMRLTVMQTAYEVFQREPERMKAVVEQAGYSVIRQPEAMEVNDKEYLYLKFDKDGVTDYLIYTATGDYTVGMLLICTYEKDSEVLELADSIAGTAAATDLPDSTYDEIVLMQVKHTMPEYEPEGCLMEGQGDVEIHYQIPEGFYENVMESEEKNRKEYIFYTQEGRICIFVNARFLNAEEAAEYSGPEDYIRCLVWEDASAEVSHTVVEGRDIYYFAADQAYISKEHTEYRYYFYGVLPLESGAYYVIEGSSQTDADALKLETYQDFFILL